MLAFPQGDYSIRQKREEWTPERTMDPLKALLTKTDLVMWDSSGDILTKIIWKI